MNAACRLCGRVVPKRKRQTFGNQREHTKHLCSHGKDCPTGKRGLVAQTLTPRCAECRADRQRQLSD